MLQFILVKVNGIGSLGYFFSERLGEDGRILAKSFGKLTSFPTLAKALRRLILATRSFRGELDSTPKVRYGLLTMQSSIIFHLAQGSRKDKLIGETKKAQDPYLLPVLQTLGIWHSRHIVERVTQSLRRMIYEIPMLKRHNVSNTGHCYHTRRHLPLLHS